jgi:hypothetical protein
MHFSIYAIGEENGNGAERLLYEGGQIDREAYLDCF